MTEGWIGCPIHVVYSQTYRVSSKESDNHCNSTSVTLLLCDCADNRGSTFADYVLSYFISPHPTSPTPAPSPPAFFRFLQSLGIETAAFEELTTRHMEDFNSVTLDDPDVRYYSFGASFTPTWGSVFRTSHGIIEAKEGPNDGLVSVSSAMWGEYKGTIRNVNHLDIINWVNHFCIVRLTGGKTNRIKYWWNGVMYGEKWAEPAFNAIAFYLHVAGNDT
jgi:triacylglycerol lipase